MNYLGEYLLEVKNGKVKIPWKDQQLKNAKWVLVETECGDSVSINLFIEPLEDPRKHLEEHIEEDMQIRIIDFGVMNLSSDYLWELPQQVKDFLEDNTIIFIGLEVDIQVMSKKQHEEMMIAEGELKALLDEHFSMEQYDTKAELQRIASKLAIKHIKGCGENEKQLS